MLNLDTNVAHLPGRITKNGKPRDVPLSPAATVILGDRSRKGEKAFAIQPHSIIRALERAAVRASAAYVERCKTDRQTPDSAFLVDPHFHDLRHEACSRLAKIFALHELMKIVGHSSPRMLMRYYHPSAAEFAQRMRAK